MMWKQQMHKQRCNKVIQHFQTPWLEFLRFLTPEIAESAARISSQYPSHWHRWHESSKTVHFRHLNLSYLTRVSISGSLRQLMYLLLFKNMILRCGLTQDEAMIPKFIQENMNRSRKSSSCTCAHTSILTCSIPKQAYPLWWNFNRSKARLKYLPLF